MSLQERAEEPPVSNPCPPTAYTPHALNVSPSHRFALAGHAQLTINDIADSCRLAYHYMHVYM